MEKTSISGKDILRMDGLLPPTRRLPVCDAVTSSDKKKEKKWSLGGILKRISSIRDCDSSSNDEEIVYCTRQPRRRTVFNRKSRNVVLHPLDKNSDQQSNDNDLNHTASRPLDTLSLQRDSLHSRSSDGSLEGLSKKARKNKLKSRIEAKRDRICADTSSDEDSRISSNSLTRYQTELAMQSAQKNNSNNRKSRAARTQRYIKRLSTDDNHRFPENVDDTNIHTTLQLTNEEQSSIPHDGDALFCHPPHSPRFISYSNSNTFPVQRSVESQRQTGMVASNYQARSSNDLVQQSVGQYITDFNQNNTYAKPNILQKNKDYVHQEESRHFFDTSMVSTNSTDPYDYAKNHQFTHRSLTPPEPPPRTRHDDTLRMKMNDIHKLKNDLLIGLKSYESNSKTDWYGSISTKKCTRRPLSLSMGVAHSCNSSECTNNKHNSTGRHTNESIFEETEEMKCQRRNNRNDQLTSCYKDYDNKIHESKSSTTYIKNMRNKNSAPATANKSMSPAHMMSPMRQIKREHSYDLPNDASTTNSRQEIMDEKQIPTEQEKERRRSLKNLEEALYELEAIYNSLCLGDEDLLDRAERRSMEEFSLRRAKTNAVPFISEDLTDRTKDDMAYRRMHPKERPASLSEVVGQSTLSNISYLIASPILARKDVTDDYLYATNYLTRRDEPDVTRDDVVYRSIHHANNTLKVIEPQPPFGIPLGPVTSATESDYLHTTPTKPEHPRSLYIPQCEPDIVTDDLAYRTLRKDANVSKRSIDNKDQETTFGTKKKRAVRSLSANLYGLINHDTIHLRREPSLQEFKQEMCNTFVDINSLPIPPVRRVMSDGELSDYDTRWCNDNLLKTTKSNVNGIYPITNTNRKKLRVYVSPSNQVQNSEEENEESRMVDNSIASTDILSKALNNDFWQNSIETKPEDSTNQDAESDFTAYSRLCQDLVNLIEGQTDEEVKAIEQMNVTNDADKTVDSSSILHIQSLGSHYTINDDEDTKEQVESKEDTQIMQQFSTEDNPEKTDDNTFDFYLRVADENVKLIVEAFSSVADHLRDSRLSQKNSPTLQPREIETDSTATPNTSTRSSVTYSLLDTNEDLSSSSEAAGAMNIVPKEETMVTISEEHHDATELEEMKIDSSSGPEHDLSKAVYDLQLAAASLCDHGKEIEELEALLKRDTTNNFSRADDSKEMERNELSLDTEINATPEDEKVAQEYDEDETVILTDDKSRTDERNRNCEGESTECKDICVPYDIADSTEMRVSYVTNLITILITTYSMVLLACFLALLLATVAAS